MKQRAVVVHLQRKKEKKNQQKKKLSIPLACKSALGSISNQRESYLTDVGVKTEEKKKLKKLKGMSSA